MHDCNLIHFMNRRLLARPGLCRTVRRGHNIWFRSRFTCATLPLSPREGPDKAARSNVPIRARSAGSWRTCKRTKSMRCWDVMNTGQFGRSFDEGSAEDGWTTVDGSQRSQGVSAQTARGGWPVWGQASEMDETARASLTGRQLQSHDTGDASSDQVESLSPCQWCHGSLASRECAV